MRHAIIESGEPLIISNARPFVDDAGIQHPRSIFTIWTRAEKLAIGIYEVVDAMDDQSTGPDYNDSAEVLAINGDHVTATRTRTDMTAQEIIGRDNDTIAREFGEATDRALFLAFNAICYLARNPHNASLTLPQIKTALENPDNRLIDQGAFRDWMRGLRF